MILTQFDRYVLIDIPLDPNNPLLQMITHEYNKLYSTEVEDILEFFSTFDNIVKTLALPQGSTRAQKLYQAILTPIYGGGHFAQHQRMDV
jgi:hypothetical protein